MHWPRRPGKTWFRDQTVGILRFRYGEVLLRRHEVKITSGGIPTCDAAFSPAVALFFGRWNKSLTKRLLTHARAGSVHNAAYTAISGKVVGKSAREHPERYCGLLWVHCFSKKFERMTREAMDVCLRVLKESSKSRFDSYIVRNSVLIISHITFWDCRVHIFSDNVSRWFCTIYLFRWSDNLSY